jgi:hypothetical protein
MTLATSVRLCELHTDKTHNRGRSKAARLVLRQYSPKTSINSSRENPSERQSGSILGLAKPPKMSANLVERRAGQYRVGRD